MDYTDSAMKEVLFRRLSALSECYSTGYFVGFVIQLADDCVFESQWVWQPKRGKEEVMAYFLAKGETFQANKSCPSCVIVELIGNLNQVKDADFQVNGQPTHGSFGLWYEDGKLCLLMRQNLDGQTISVIVDLKLNDQGLISRIDLCMPELFRYREYVCKAE